MYYFISILWDQIQLSMPLSLLILLGYMLVRFGEWPKNIADGLTRFVFSIAVPIMLFRLISNESGHQIINIKLLLVFFGSCFIVFLLSRFIATKFFHLDGVSGSVFALGGIFSNNIMLGLPVATLLLGNKAIPIVALILIFNALLLWTLVTISVEWARHGRFTVNGFLTTLINVLKTPIIIGILSAVVVKWLQIPQPKVLEQTTMMISQMAAPLSLIALGMGLAEYRISDGWKISATICTIKLIIMPLVVYLFARILNLPLLETQTVIILASMAMGANVYLMSLQFNVLIGQIASSLVLSTLLAGITTPLILTLIQLLQ